jgi:hypothetical protein
MAKKIARGDNEKIKSVDLLKNNNLDLLVLESVQTVDRLVKNENVAANTRLAAARTVLELAGLIGPGRQNASANKAPDTLSDAELRRAIDAHTAALSDRAKPVSAPNVEVEAYNLLNDIG